MNRVSRLSASAEVKSAGIMSRVNAVANRMRWLTAAVVLLGVQGCGDEGQKPGKTVDPCVSACADPGSGNVTDTTGTGTDDPPADACEEATAPDCGDHGVCSEVEQVAVCACDPGYGDGSADDDCSVCSDGYIADKNGDCGLDATVPFSPDNIFLAWGLFGPADSGRVEVSGKTGADARFNGYYVDISAGSFTQPTYVGIRPAVGTGLSFSGSGELIAASGADFVAVVKDDEYKPVAEGETVTELKTVQPSNSTEVKYTRFRGTSYSYDPSSNGFTKDPSSSQVADGTVARLNSFSPHYLVDGKAQMNNTVTEGTDLGEFYFDLSAVDEGTADGLTYGLSVTAGTVTQETGSRWHVIFPEGNNTATARVYDQFGTKIAEQAYSINVSAPVLLDNVDVSCAPNAITTGESSECDATAYWSNATQASMDADCSWAAVTGTVDGGGTFSPAPVSETDEVSCTYGGMTGKDWVTVSAVRTGVAVVCNPNAVQVGGTVECDAEEQMSDGTTSAVDDQCVWSTDGGTIDATGSLTAPSAAEIATSPTTINPDCDLGDGFTDSAAVEVTAEAPSAWNLDAGCGGSSCTPNANFSGTFMYSGDVSAVTGWCTITSGTPGIITNIQLDGNGNGTFEYNSSADGAFAQETIHIKLFSPSGVTEVTTTHIIF